MPWHLCPVDGCRRQGYAAGVFCWPHYLICPPAMRTRIWRAWDHGRGQGTPAHNELSWLCLLAIQSLEVKPDDKHED